jgi:hypothetical protein
VDLMRRVLDKLHLANRTQPTICDLCPTAAISSVGREYHDRNPVALTLVGTVQGFLPGFTSSSGFFAGSTCLRPGHVPNSAHARPPHMVDHSLEKNGPYWTFQFDQNTVY